MSLEPSQPCRWVGIEFISAQKSAKCFASTAWPGHEVPTFLKRPRGTKHPFLLYFPWFVKTLQPETLNPRGSRLLLHLCKCFVLREIHLQSQNLSKQSQAVTRNHLLDKRLGSSRSAASCSLESARIRVMPLGCASSSLLISLRASKQFIHLLTTALRGFLRPPFKGVLNWEHRVLMCRVLLHYF